MATIHEMYGKLCELQQTTEEARVFLLNVLAEVKNGKIELAQLEFPTTGGIRIIPLSELPDSDAVEETEEPEAE